jgi:hypothetical protein
MSIDTFVPGVIFFASAAKRFRSVASSQMFNRLSMMTIYTCYVYVSSRYTPMAGESPLYFKLAFLTVDTKTIEPGFWRAANS